MAKRPTPRLKKEDRDQLVVDVFELFLERLKEILTSKTATSTDMQLIYKVLQDNSIPLQNLREALMGDGDDGEDGGVADFIKNLPFPKEKVG